jgi:hypothetical protein
MASKGDVVMTPFGKIVATELRGAVLPLESVSIVDHQHLLSTIRALLKNALFYVVPDPAIDAAREHAIAQAAALVAAIQADGVRTQGISLDVDQARAEAILAMQALIDRVADAEPTITARSLGII